MEEKSSRDKITISLGIILSNYKKLSLMKEFIACMQQSLGLDNYLRQYYCAQIVNKYLNYTFNYRKHHTGINIQRIQRPWPKNLS